VKRHKNCKCENVSFWGNVCYTASPEFHSGLTILQIWLWTL